MESPVAGRAMKQSILKPDNHPRKSQALSELAIFGTLIIAAFAAVLVYIQSMNSQQSLQMKAFRTAFQLSRGLNKEVSYTIIKDTPVVDFGDLFGRPDISRATASSTVVAMTKDTPTSNIRDRDSLEFYEVNGNRQEISPIKINIVYSNGNTDAWIAAPISDVEYTTTKTRAGNITRNEGGSSITSTQTGTVSGQTTADLVLEDQATFTKNYLEDAEDNVQTEPWVKRVNTEHVLRVFVDAIEITVIGLIERFLPIKYNCGITPNEAMGIVYIGLGLITTDLLMYYLPNNAGGPDAKVVGVSIAEGYRERDSVGGSVGFSPPQQTFGVSK